MDASQKQVEILTGYGGGDCGYPFLVGTEYVIYANQDSQGRLETGTCTRTRPLTGAAEDVEYIRKMSTAPRTGDLRVITAFPGIPGQSGAAIIAEGEGRRVAVVADGAGEALFKALSAGEYTLHVQSDGDLPDDPKVQLHAKGCMEAALFRSLRITGRVVTKSGLPAARIPVQYRSTDNQFGDGSLLTNADGRYELRIVRPGQYNVGINLNEAPTQYAPYPRWFLPGTEDPVAATKIDFSGKPMALVRDLTLPDPLPERTVSGGVVRADGDPAERSAVTAFDAFGNFMAQAYSDASGHFTMQIFVGTFYRLHAVMPGREAVSAVPVDIAPGNEPLSLHLTLNQPGNSTFDVTRSKR